MKTIYLLRHAKSSWDDPTLNDYDRPLNDRGKRDAPFMGKKLKEKGVMPSLILSSTAKRAAKTVKKVASEMGYPKGDIQFMEEIYEAFTKDLLKIVRSIDDKHDSVMLVGHNPEFTAFSNLLSDNHIYNIPTCGVSCISFETDTWKDVDPQTGKSLFFDYPKKYL